MKSRTRTLHGIGRTMVVPVILVMLACVGASGPSMAADNCNRHIYNQTNRTLHFMICNTAHECGDYPVPPNSKVAIGIPRDIAYSLLSFPRYDVPNSIHRYVVMKHNANMAGDMCHIESVVDQRWAPGCKNPRTCKVETKYSSLRRYPQKSWLTVNEPADGDIQISGTIKMDWIPAP